MNSKNALSGFLTVLLHGVFLGWVFNRDPLLEKKTLPTESIELVLFDEALQVTNQKQEASVKKRSTIKGAKSPSASRKKTRREILQSLEPSTVLRKKDSLSSQPQVGDGEWSEGSVMGTMSSLGLSEYSSNHYFFSALTENINQGVGYPRDYAMNGITGRLWVRILVNSKGQIVRVLESSKNNPILCTYVLVNLFQILKKPLPKSKWFQGKRQLAFQLNFDFSVSSVFSMPYVRSVKFHKNAVHFVRREKIPNLMERMNQKYSRYIPPIAITPAGPVVNFVQVYRMIKGWQELDPAIRSRTRLELTHEKFNELLKVKKTQPTALEEVDRL